MNRAGSLLVISAGVLLCGCSASPVPQTLGSTSPPATTNPTTTPGATSSPPPRFTGNWQFTATPSMAGTQPFSIAGGVSQPLGYTAVSGTLHIDNPNCFDPLIGRTVAGTVSADTTSFTATGSDGQVVTFSGSFDEPSYDVVINEFTSKTFTGTYKVDGGCAGGDQGTVTGSYIYSIGPQYDPFQWTGTFTNIASQEVFHGTGKLTQSQSPDAEGSFWIAGNGTMDIACLSDVSIKSGTYPSGSFILGTAVAIEFDAQDGAVNFLGTLDPDTNLISGNYTVTGSSCNQSGTAVVQMPTGCPGCWD